MTERDNNSLFNVQHLGPRFEISNDSCKLLPSANSSLPLAPRWENIPEELLLNAFVGGILFILFLIMTRIAWNQSNSSDNQINQGLISFLYGYRDPERWYVIPRFEFLRYKDRQDRHHKHQADYLNLYIPPKLPLANPADLLNFDEQSLSNEEETKTNSRKTISSKQPAKSANKSTIPTTTSTTTKEPTGSTKTKVASVISKKISNNNHVKLTSLDIEANNNQTNKQALDDSNSTSSSNHNNTQPSQQQPTEQATKKSIDPFKLESAFFYPSILTAEQLQASYLSRKLNSFFGLFFKVTDADIIFAKGIDAYEYLLFQRHLILIMFITNLFCLGIILPIHWFSDPESLFSTSFQRTTIKNVNANSILYWAHIISSVCIVIVTRYILNSYRESTITKSYTQLARRTLLIGNIPLAQRNRVKLMKIFQEYFPKSKIEAIQFVYDSTLLERYQAQLDAIMVARKYCTYYRRKYNQDIMVKQTDVNEEQRCSGYCRLCSYFCVCCCYWPRETKLPGTIHYAKEEEIYREKIRIAFEAMVKNPSEYAFVTVQTYRQAKRIMQQLTKFKAETLKDTNILAHLNARRSFENQEKLMIDKSVDSVDSVSQSSSKAIKGTTNLENLEISQRKLEVANNLPNDPLDPRNNPHVRSIRSPIIKKLSTKIIAQNNEGNIEQLNQQKESPSQRLKSLGPLSWSVRYAPHPDNVGYYDLLHIATISKYTIVLFYLLMIIIFIFFTTPNVILSIFERSLVLKPNPDGKFAGFKGLFLNYLSTLVQITTTALLPGLIVLISKQMPYEDSASKNHSIMWKVYAFLVLMVIVMPSVGMSSAQAFFSSEINPKCLFPTDNGAYFIKYVSSSIFLSTVLELIKPMDILFYSFILLTSRSIADFEGGRQYIEREFSVGMQHTSVLLVFTVVMTYTISCPLIAPAGLVYLIVKHSVDHYHLFYTYFTKKVDEHLQNTILIFVKLSLLLMLFQTTVSLSINTGVGYFSLMSQIVFLVSLAVFLFNCFFEFTSRSMKYDSSKRNKFQREFCACFYMPRVIEDLLRCKAIPESCVSRQV